MPRSFDHIDRVGRTVSVARAARGCFEKKWFASRNAARDKAAKVKARTGAEQKPYRCALCSGWHLTTVHEPERKRA